MIVPFFSITKGEIIAHLTVMIAFKNKIFDYYVIGVLDMSLSYAPCSTRNVQFRVYARRFSNFDPQYMYNHLQFCVPLVGWAFPFYVQVALA